MQIAIEYSEVYAKRTIIGFHVTKCMSLILISQQFCFSDLANCVENYPIMHPWKIPCIVLMLRVWKYMHIKLLRRRDIHTLILFIIHWNEKKAKGRVFLERESITLIG